MTAAPRAQALEVGGVRFPATQALDGRMLVLNGAGVRVKMIIKVYALGLYLPQRQDDARLVLAGDGPRRVQLVLLRDLDAERMAHGLGQAMLDGATPAQASALHARVQQLTQALLAHGDAHRGDVFLMDYRPGQGTRVSLSGQTLCADIAGADFNEALLAMWLGAQAPDEHLRSALLGRVQP